MRQLIHEKTAGMQLMAFCETWQPFRNRDWSEESLAEEMGWSVPYLHRVLHEELETDFTIFRATYRLAFVQKMRKNTAVKRLCISRMAGFNSLKEEEISRKMLVFFKGFF